MGNLGASASMSHKAGNNKFRITGPNVAKFDAASNLNIKENRGKVRPSTTEVGRQRMRHQVTEPVSTSDIMNDYPEQTTNALSYSGKKTRNYDGAKSSHTYKLGPSSATPRFSIT